MSGCTVTGRPCGADPVAEVRVTRGDLPPGRWQEACYRHAAGFVAYAEARGFGVEERPVGLLRDVLEHIGDADVVPITRAERVA